MIKKLLGLFLTAFILSSHTVSADNIGFRIVGGADAPDGRWSSVVAIKQKRNDEVICGGNLISPEWVITAAHCIEGNVAGLSYSYSNKDLLVYTGSQDLFSEFGRNVRIRHLIIHPEYDPEAATNDLALIHLEYPVRRSVVPNYNISYLAPGEAVVIVGWGARNMENGEPVNFPNRLNQAVVPIVARETCNSPDSYNGKITNRQICAGFIDGGRDSCIGDSGGPLFIKRNDSFRQIGIVSYGQGCGKSNKYGVYTFLPPYAEWIYQYVPLPVMPDESHELKVDSPVKAGGFDLILLLIFLFISFYGLFLNKNTRRS